MAELYRRLSNVTVVDRQEFNKISTEELPAKIVEIYAGPNNPVFIDAVPQYFSTVALDKAFETNDPTLELRALYNGVTITPADRILIDNYHAFKSRILELTKPALPPYEFATPPEGWNGDEALEIKTNSIIRRNSGRSYDRSIGMLAAVKLWKEYSPVWAGLADARQAGCSVKAGGSSRYTQLVGANHNRIQVGCQHIERHELEYVALKLGWAFPEPKPTDEG